MSQFCKRLKEAIADERKAPPMYEKLLAETPSTITRVRGRQAFDPHTDISSIIHDERRHAKTLEELDKKLCRGRRT